MVSGSERLHCGGKVCRPAPSVPAGWSSASDCAGRGPEEMFRGLPVDALVGDGLTVGEVRKGLGKLLVPGYEIALQHGANDPFVTCSSLTDDLFEHGGHLLVIFPTVGVGSIDHHGGGESCFPDLYESVLNVRFVVVGTVLTTSQDDMAVGVAGGRDGGGNSLF